MHTYTKAELTTALRTVTSSILRCEKMSGKFAEGSSQDSLLKNRLNALAISELLLKKELTLQNPAISLPYTKEELKKALPPLTSIFSKCKKAQAKYDEGTTQYNRYKNLISAMEISQTLLKDMISRS